MRKLLFLLLFMLIFPCSFALADASLEEHGPELLKASFPIRYKFEQVYHKPWLKSTYEERRKFLMAWYKEESAQARREQDEANREAQEKRETDKQVLAEQRRLAALKKAYEKQDDDTHREKAQERRDFDRITSDQARELRRLQSSNK